MSFAYDIAAPALARRARALLCPRAGSRQYSLYECRLSAAETATLLAGLDGLGLPARDRLAWWWPKGGMRLALQASGRCSLRDEDGVEHGMPLHDAARRLGGCGNYLLSYDVSGRRALRAVQAEAARGGLMLQRSLYQWRCSVQALDALLQRCRGLLDAGDRFWVHPLARITDLRELGGPRHDLLPVAGHHWQRPHPGGMPGSPTFDHAEERADG